MNYIALEGEEGQQIVGDNLVISKADAETTKTLYEATDNGR